MPQDDSDRLNDLIDEAITALADDNPEAGADCLVELAHIFAKAGVGRTSFNNIRQHITQEAIKRTSAPFIHYKLKQAERKLRNGRTIVSHAGQTGKHIDH